MIEIPFQPISVYDLRENVFRIIDKDWFLLTAGSTESYNTMTASWGGLGILWNKPVAFCFVRPTRYTYTFMEKNDCFTMSFFTEKYRKALNACGSKSGRNTDKAALTGLTPVSAENGTVFFNESRLVLECKKIYYTDIDPARFLEEGIIKNYPKNDFHRMYVGEITGCRTRD